MNCKDATYKIEMLKSNEEIPEDVKNHIEICSDCRNYYEFLNSVDRIGDIWPDVYPDEDLPKRIIDFVAEKTNWGRRRKLWPAISGIAASLVLGFFIGHFIYNASQVQAQVQNESSITESSENNYMAQTTDLLYYEAFMTEGDNYEK